MSKSRLSTNAMFSVAAVVCSALIFFELYRFLAGELGPEKIGVWSLTVAFTAIGRVGDLGLGVAVVKFVAGDVSTGRLDSAAGTVGLSVFSAAFVMALLCLGLSFAYPFYIHSILTESFYLDIALWLVPWTLASLWISSIANIFMATLDATQRTGVRACITIGASAIQLLSAYILVPEYGLYAMGSVQICFSVSTLVVSGVAACLILNQPATRWVYWPRQRACQLLRSGSGFQLATIGQIAFEPSIKWLLGLQGNLELTGYYEMANRAALQIRTVIASAFQMLVPYVAGKIANNSAEELDISQAYRKASRVLLLIAVPYFFVVACALPLVLTFWIGSFNYNFIFIGLVCTFGWFFNSLALPSYFIYIANGRVSWAIKTQWSIGLLNLIIASFLGSLFGSLGVVSGAMLALGLGSSVVIFAFHREYKINFIELIQPDVLVLFLVGVSLFLICLNASFTWAGRGATPLMVICIVCAYSAFALYKIYRDKNLMRTIRINTSPAKKR